MTVISSELRYSYPNLIALPLFGWSFVIPIRESGGGAEENGVATREILIGTREGGVKKKRGRSEWNAPSNTY